MEVCYFSVQHIASCDACMMHLTTLEVPYFPGILICTTFISCGKGQGPLAKFILVLKQNRQREYSVCWKNKIKKSK